MAHNRVIGKDNGMPWHLPADLKHFKRATLHHHIIMGRNCYESIGMPLPKRTNIVLTRDPFYMISSCLVAHSIDEALNMAYDNGEEEAFIIGGGHIYEQTQDMWDRLYLTEIDLKVEGDTFFPALDYEAWDLIEEKKHKADDKNPHDYVFKTFEKK